MTQTLNEHMNKQKIIIMGSFVVLKVEYDTGCYFMQNS
jgi:hypothetical protein